MPTAPKWRPLLLRFIQNLRIVSREETAAPGEAGIQIKLWRSQQRILEELTAGMDEGIRRFYVLKSRQLGSTTIFVIIALFWLALHPGMKGALVVDQEKTRDDFREQIRNLIASIPLKYFGAAFAIKKGGDNKYFMAFSNGSQLNFLVAGTSGTKVAWGESSGFSLVLLTEVANYGSPEGLTNFEEAMSEQNPDRLYVYESTAKGFNHWRQRWLAARGDAFTNRCIFVGWWAKEANSIKRSSPLFAIWGLAEPDDRERTRIKVVKERYGWEITPEQLAWHRWRASKDHQTESSLNQNQPWIEEDAFVMSGQSYFQLRRIAHDYERIEREGVAYQGYRFWLGNDFWAAGVENLAGDVLRQHEVQLRMWVPPHPEGRYVIGCDPAGGSDEKNDRHCSDEATEILTRDGWKTYDQVAIGDQAVCFDLATGCYEYGAVSDIVIRRHCGTMHHFTSDGLDCLVTPEHRVVYRLAQPTRTQKFGPWKVRAAAEISANQGSVKGVPVGGAPCGAGIEGLSLPMCRALGWILSDGHIHSGASGNARPYIILAQATDRTKGGSNVAAAMVDVISTLCDAVSVTRREGNDTQGPQVVIRICVKSADEFLRWLPGQVCLKSSRRIPRRLITEASHEQLHALFQGILEGDGGWDPVGGVWVKVCPGLSRGLADDIQEIAARLGWSATRAFQKPGAEGERGQWLVRLSPRSHHCIRKERHEVAYDGIVWCVTVPTGAFVARRNGKMFVTGNCISAWRCYADKLVQVAEYADNIAETRQAAWVLAYLAGIYQNCTINIELSGGYGKAVLVEFDHLREILRGDVYRAKRGAQGRDLEDFLDNARYHLYRRPDNPASAGYVTNFLTTGDNKRFIFNEFRDSHVNEMLVINSKPLLEEMQIVVQDGMSIEAPNGAKDDRVFAACLANTSWVQQERGTLLMLGETYAACEMREAGGRPAGNMVDQIVQQYLRQVEAGQIEEVGPAQRWMEERGLA